MPVRMELIVLRRADRKITKIYSTLDSKKEKSCIKRGRSRGIDGGVLYF